MSNILRRGAAVALLLAMAAAVAWSAPAPDLGEKDPRSPQQIDEARRDLRHLRKLAEDPKPDLEELWLTWQRFRTAHAGTPEWVQACAVMAKAPSPLDNLDREQIPEEDRPAWLPKEVVAVLGEQRGRHWGWVMHVAVTSDAKRILSSSETVRVWDAATLQERAALPSDFKLSAFAADGSCVAVANDSDIAIWDLSGNQPKKRIAEWR